MSRLSVLTCPKCGAEASHAVVGQPHKCVYCGTVATVKASSPAVRQPAAGVAHPHGSTLPLLLGCGGLVVAALAVGGVFLGSSSQGAEQSPPSGTSLGAELPPDVAESPTEPQLEQAVQPAPPPPVTRRIRSAPAALYEDLDGDGAFEIIAYVERVEGADRSERFAVFDSQTGAVRVETPAVTLGREPMAARVGTRVVVAGERGQLEAYDLGSGDRQWSSTLGDRALALCAAGRDDAVRVSTADERMLEVDLITGRQTEVRARCEHRLARSDRGLHDPSDRSDAQAPPGVEAYVCGSTRVMGSSNYVVPDACLRQGHVDSNGLDGMVAHRIWRLDHAWLVMGVRKPGAYVPMVGVLTGRSFRWKSEVPATNPLDASQGGPRYAAVVGDAVVVSYEMDTERTYWLTAFALEDGRRRWATGVATEASLHGLASRGDGLFAHVGNRILVLDPATGATLRSVGDE
ncbi:MAG: PQQ-binding-like beta-propeller repeat protein [Sandaracinaceae bacterium]|nr:PQQ-binding-like beta-propeller repeat protein [Sandaracinaceae bacterium]